MKDDARIAPLPIDDEISSLSAILLNEEYYELLRAGMTIVDNIPVLTSACLIPFKAKAWLDLSERKARGEHVDSTSINKHKNDVFRLAQLIIEDSRYSLAPEIRNDMGAFLLQMADEDIDLKSLKVRIKDKDKILAQLRRNYGIDK